MQRIAVMFGATGLVMWLVFNAAQWYAETSSLPRYCGNPAAAVEHVRQILTTQRPVGSESKRPFVVAAKLIFLVPRADGEAIAGYLQRLRRRIDETCRVS